MIDSLHDPSTGLTLGGSLARTLFRRPITPNRIVAGSVRGFDVSTENKGAP